MNAPHDPLPVGERMGLSQHCEELTNCQGFLVRVYATAVPAPAPSPAEAASIDPDVARAHSASRLAELGLRLPLLAELAAPESMPAKWQAAALAADRLGPDFRNLYRLHWFNRASSPELAAVPEHVVLPESLTGVASPIVVALGDRFPMIGAHKVLPAYACLASRLATGRFDPTLHRAVWPSTGNYARGGVAISRILGCRGVAVLPAGMSAERFEWLERWVTAPEDIVRTPGTESNVKEIYDACDRLAADPANVVLNQFAEMPNHLAHYFVTGAALDRLVRTVIAERPGAHLVAFVSASGSAGTLAAGDYLKERHGSLSAVVEALECPTLLECGFGEHDIQGIGDKHVPLVHNTSGTDVVVGVSDSVTDALDVVFAAEEGRELLGRRGVGDDVLIALDDFGLSAIANVVASIKLAKRLRLGPTDVICTVATDGAGLYALERAGRAARLGADALRAGARSPELAGPLGADALAWAVGRYLDAVADDHVLELTSVERRRIFNLGYFTWVEQRGVPLEDFEARRDPAWWAEQRSGLAALDASIAELNRLAGTA